MLLLRTFKVTPHQALTLANRAEALGVAVGDLVRTYVDEYVANPTVYSFVSEVTEIHSFYLTPEQDDRLQIVADQHNLPKGLIFRLAINNGLGINR